MVDQRLTRLYQSIDQRGRQMIADHQIQGDPYLPPHHPDSRRGLTLLCHFPAHVQRNIQFCLTRLHQVEPSLYCYPSAYLHITILDLLKIRDHFTISADQLARYQVVVQQVLQEIDPVSWRFQGLYLSPAGIIVGGYYSPSLAKLRQSIRHQCQNAGLPVEERYETYSGHATIARFSAAPKQPTELMQTVDQLHDLQLGQFTSHHCQLVVHDWFNRQVDYAINLAMPD